MKTIVSFVVKKPEWGYKTIMGTIPRISSHSPFTTEAVNDVRLLLFWPAASSDTRPVFATHGFQVQPVTAEPSGFPFFPSCDGNSGMKCHSGAGTYFPKDIASVSVNPGPKPFIFWSPVTQSLKERFRHSLIFRALWTRSLLVRTSARLMRRPGGLNEADSVSIK